MTMTHRIEQFLDEHHIPYRIVLHEHTATSLQSAHAAHVDPARLAKAVLLQGDDGPMAAMIPADQQVRIGQLREDFGDQLHLADEASIQALFSDCDPGAVPGLPMAWGIETVWDEALLARSDLFLEAGDHERLIHLETRRLLDAVPEMAHCHFAADKKHH